MLSATTRLGALLCLLLAGSLALCAPQAGSSSADLSSTLPLTPGAKQAERDRRFLLHRGIGPTTNTATAPLRALQAARVRQAAAVLAAGRGKATPDGQMPAPSTGTWQPAGPVQLSTPAYGLVTGRVSSLAVDPSDSSGNTVYLGATGGGVWKSTNAAGSAGSVSFSPLTDDIAAFANSFQSFPSISIGALTVQPGDSQVLLAGTGDPNDALDSYYGVGILRSTNAGQTWSLISESRDGTNHGASENYAFTGNGFAGFAWSTATPNLVVAAVSQSAEGLIVNTGFESTAEAGLFYSSDAGQTWYLATVKDGSQPVQSPNYNAMPPGNPATAVVWNPQRQLFIAAIRFHGYYSSPDGINWSRLANQPGSGLSTTMCPANPGNTGSVTCPIFRGALAVQPVTGDTFALTTDINNADQGLYRDVCSNSGTQASTCTTSTISFGTQINDAALDDPNSPGYIDQADYNLALSAVSLQQDTILFAGTEDIYRCSLANSCTWRNTTNDQTCAAAQVAPSTHAIAGVSAVAGLVYFGNDGGLWRSTDDVAQTGSVCAASDASHYQNLNGGIGSLAEIEHLAVSPNDSALVLAGMGEFGVVASESTAAQGGTGPWQQLLTGEGSYVAIDPNTPGNWYADSGPGVSIFSCAQGANCDAASFGAGPVIGRSQVEDDADYFVDAAPWMLDPGNANNILLGTCRMWLGPVNGDWSSSNLLSTMLDGNQGSYCDGNAQLRSVAAGGSYNSAAGGEQMYAGMAGPLDGGGAVPGHIYGATVPQAGGEVSWTDLWRNPVENTSLSSQFNAGGYSISAIAVDPHDSTGKTIYVGISGFPSGQSGNLYSSTDGGAHWYNITNSLPYSPLNSIVVDPNNSGYVYVGGDFGVYYTTNIANCTNTSGECWIQFASGLPDAPVTGLRIVSTGSGTALVASTYGRGIWTLGLTSTAVPAQATLTPASYLFPSEGTGTTSPPASFTLANTGSVPLAIAGISASPTDYGDTNNCGASLAAGSSCTIQVTFTPSTTGGRPGTLTVRGNTQSGSLVSTLNGTGLTPGAISVSPSSLSFPATATGTGSQPMNVSISNTGQASVPISSIALVQPSTDFSLSSNNCPSTLAGGASCTVAVVFSPARTGTRTGQLEIQASAPGSPFLVPLSGSGVSPAALSVYPGALSFAETPVSSAAPAQALTVTNTGGVAAQLGTATAHPSDYNLASNGCGTTLAAGASCTVSITFSPTQTGSRAGLFTLPSPSIAAGQVTASLSGNGVAPPLSPNPLTFPTQQVQTTSAAQSLTVTNTGTSAAQLGTPVLNGTAFSLASDNCPSSLAPGGNCTLGITFTPPTVSTRTGTLTLLYNGASTTASLTGTGTAPGALAFSPPSLSFATTVENTTAPTQSVNVTNNGGSPAQFSSVTVTGPFAIASSTCPAAGQTLAVNASCTLGISFTPPGASAYSGSVAISGGFSNSPASVTLNGQGAAPPNATLTPNALSFPGTAQGSASAAQTLTVTSTGGVPVTLGTAAITSGFQIAQDTCGSTLAPGATCSIAVEFIPSTQGAQTGSLSQPGNMAGSPLTAALNGNGLQPGQIKLTPAALQFGSEVIGVPSAAQSVAIQNTGGAPASLGTPGTSSSDYTVSGTCPSSLGAGQSCTVSVSFDPTAQGDRPGQLTVAWGGSNVASATLDGTGITPGHLSLTPSSLAFGAVATGSSATLTVTAINGGGASVHLSAINIGGSTDFSVSGGTCSIPSSIPANGGTCTLTLTFTPSGTGNRSGTLTLTNDGSPGSVQAGLAGVGATPGNVILSPTSLGFGEVVINTASSSQTITATNYGGVPVTLSTPAVTPTNAYQIVGNTCGGTLAAGATCSLQLTFTPPAQGADPGTFSFPGQYSGSPATAMLTGTGVTPGALAFNPSPVPLGQVVLGSTGSQSVTLQNTGGAPVSLGTPSASSGFGVTSQCGSTLAPDASCMLRVSFTPSTAGPVQGLLSVPSSVGASAATDALSGTGLRPGALSASSPALQFPATVVGATSASQSVTFQNTGDVSVALASRQVSSTDYSVQSSSCGASLAPNAVCSVTVAFTPTTNGSRPGTLTLAGSGSSPPTAQVALSGTGLLPAHLVFSPMSLAFGGHPVNTTSASQTLTLENSGQVSTGIALPVLTGQYAITADTCGSTLGGGAGCAIAVQFAPTQSGSLPGTLSVASPSGTLSASAALSGTGLALELSPASYTFTPPLPVGSTSQAVLIGIENLGSANMTLQPPTITGDFALGSSSCGTTLAANTTCGVYVTFTPTAAGQRAGVLTVSVGTETDTVQLLGTGLAPATDTLSTGGITFGLTEINNTSAAQTVTLTNSGDATLQGISVQSVPPSPNSPFTPSNNCGASLGGHLSCVIAVTFTPTALGSTTGALVIKDAQRSQTVSLSGEGAPPPQAFASPSSVNFGPFALGVATAPQIVLISNQGTVPMSGVTVMVSGGDFTLASSNCGASLAPGASCQAGLVFTPSTAGNREGTLTVSSPSLAAPLVVSLAGSGEDFQIAVTGSASQVITPGQPTQPYTLNITPVGASTGLLTMTCSGAPADMTCTINPTTLTVSAGASGSVAVTIAPSQPATTAQSVGRVRWWAGSALAVALFWTRRKDRKPLLMLLAAALLCIPIGCGVHASGINGQSSTPAGQTPSGSYTITVTASFPGATRSTQLTLVVQ